MAAQPGRHGLVAHKLGILVTRPAQGHHEEPCLEYLAGVHIGDKRAGTEINLHRFARFECQA